MRGVVRLRSSVVLGLIGLILALVQVWIRLQVVAIGYTLSNTRQLLHALEGERQTLVKEWSARTAPGQLGDRAAQRLGLNTPQPEQMIKMR
jgi:hypothetical protein